jgi:hypothetical protein
MNDRLDKELRRPSATTASGLGGSMRACLVEGVMRLAQFHAGPASPKA